MRSRYWLLNLFCGLAILLLLGWHLAVMHLDGLLGLIVPVSTDPLAWEHVVARGKNAVVAGTYVLLLGIALFHGFYGLRTVLTEYWPSKGAETLITAVCWTAGGTLFTVGTYTTIVFRSDYLVP